MSRTFVAASSQRLGPVALTSALRTPPITIASTFRLPTGTVQSIVAFFCSTDSFSYYALQASVSGGTYLVAATTSASIKSKASATASAAGPFPGNYIRAVARFGATNSRKISATFVGSASNTTTVTILNTIDQMTIGSRGSLEYWNTEIGPTACWADELSDSEEAAWRSGVPAEGICTSNLVYSYPLYGYNDPEHESISGNTIALVNAPAQATNSFYENAL